LDAQASEVQKTMDKTFMAVLIFLLEMTSNTLRMLIMMKEQQPLDLKAE
jgi:hypothetical protein